MTMARAGLLMVLLGSRLARAQEAVPVDDGPGRAPVEAGGWEVSFNAVTVAAGLPPSARAVVVVPAAQGDVTAATAYALALAAAGRAAAVTAPPSAPAADDVMARATALAAPSGSVEWVAVVRGVPASAGHAESVTVTLHDPKGRIVGSLLAERGVAAVGLRVAAAPMPSPELPAPLPVTRRATQRWRAERRVAVDHIWFSEPAADSPGDLEPYQGAERRRLDDPEFYEAVDRPDLASEYRRTQRTRLALGLAGLASLIVGSVILVDALFNPASYGCAQSARDGTCALYGVSDTFTARATVGGLLMAIGPGVSFTGLGIDPHPISAEETRRLALRHNEQRERSYRQREEGDSRPRSRAPGPRWTLAPAPARGGGQLSWRVSF